MSAPKKRQPKQTKELKPTSKPVSKKPKQEETPLSKLEQITVDQLIAQALIRYKDEQLSVNKHKTKELVHLANICEEYLSTFALIGYSLDNERVVVFNTPTSKDEGALVDLLRATFIDIASNRP